MKKFSLDRIEENIAVLLDEDGNVFRTAADSLPEGCREGSILKKNGSGFVLCPGETEKARRETADLQKSVFGKKKK